MPQEIKFRFVADQYSWTEKVYATQTSVTAAMTIAKNLADRRAPLCGGGIYLVEITVSDLDFPNDSKIIKNPTLPARVDNENSPVPWLGLRSGVLAQLDDPNSPFYHSSQFLRGIARAEGNIEGNAAEGFKLKGDYKTAYDAYVAKITNGNYYLQVANKAPARNKIINKAAVVTSTDLTDFNVEGAPPLAGNYVTVRGITGKWKYANGRHKIIQLDGIKMRLAVPYIADALEGDPTWTTRETIFVPIIDYLFQGVFKHDTGLTRAASKGQKKRRPTPVPKISV